MNKLIRRTITVTISETWTVTWASEAGAAFVPSDHGADHGYTRITQVVVHSSTVHSTLFHPRQGEKTDATLQAEPNNPKSG